MSASYASIGRLSLAAAIIGLLLAAAPGHAHAAFVLTLSQSGGNVVVNGAGTINLNALTLLGSGPSFSGTSPSTGILYAGPTSGNFSQYGGGGLTGPASFGTGGIVFASSGTGDFAGIYGTNADMAVPQGYLSGSPLTDSATFTGQTFATLGFTPGTYVYTWGSGANADSLTVTSVVPEPGAGAMMGVGAGLLAAALRHPKTRCPSLCRLASAAAITALLLAAAPDRVHAAFVLTLSQSGGDVVVNGSGSMNTTALTLGDTQASAASSISASMGRLYSGPSTFVSIWDYSGVTGPASFGSGSSIGGSSGTGSLAGVIGSIGLILVPQGYVSGTLLTDSSIYTGQTFATLGFTPGTYIYTWGTGANADSLTVTGVVPEPSTWALLGFGAGGVGLALRRRGGRGQS